MSFRASADQRKVLKLGKFHQMTMFYNSRHVRKIYTVVEIFNSCFSAATPSNFVQNSPKSILFYVLPF